MTAHTGAYEAARGAIQQATRSGRQAAAFARLSNLGFTDKQAWALARGGYDVTFVHIDDTLGVGA